MNILAIDDHELFRSGLKHLLQGIDGTVDYVGVGSVEEAEALQGEMTPNLILLDYFLDGVDGDDALQRIRHSFSNIMVVVISSLDDSTLIRQAVENGAAGFVPKSSSQTVLISALRLILDGGTYVPRYVFSDGCTSDTIFNSGNCDVGEIHPTAELTTRQKQVIKGVASGKSNKVIACDLNISEGTVKSHLSAAYRHLGISSRTQLVIKMAELDSSNMNC